MARTIKLNHNEIQDPQKITQVTKEAFKNEGLNIHVNEVEKINDDYKRGTRILQVKNTKYHSIGNVPWHKE